MLARSPRRPGVRSSRLQRPTGLTLFSVNVQYSHRSIVTDSHSPTSYEAGRFEIDSLEGPFEGWTTGETWNGWACPIFERHEAERIAASFRTQGKRFGFPGSYEAYFDASGDAFIFRDPNDDPDDEPLAFGSYTILVGERPITVYCIGTRYWTWEAV